MATTLEQNSGFLTKAFNKFLIPSMLISLGYTLNILFDGIIVGQKLGTDAFTAINICMPIYLILCTIGSLIGNGAYLLSSRAIGEGDFEKSKRIFNTAVVIMFVTGVLITIIGLALLTPITKLLAGGEFNPDVYSYAKITIMGSLVKMFLYLPLLYLRVVGKIKWSTISTLLMTAVNIALDLIFVCAIEMGTAGAALASVIATFVALLLGGCVLTFTSDFKFSFNFEKGIYADIVKFGAPAAMNNLMSALRVLLINTAIIHYCSGLELCIFSILNNINEISLFIVDGIPQTATPFLAIYSAEHSHKGIKIMLGHQIKVDLIFTTIFGIAIVVFANQIGALYSYTEGDLLVPFINLAFSIVFAGLSRIMIFYYNAIGENLLSTIYTALRLVVIPVGLLLPLLANNGSIWIFWPLGELATAFILYLALGIIHNKNPKKSFALLLDTSDNADEKALEFSITAENTDICSASERIADYCSECGLPQKSIMRISLAIEEILTIMNQKCLNSVKDATFDMRVFTSEEKTGIRIRCLGFEFNPLDEHHSEDPEFDEFMGIKMISSMTSKIDYSYVCGVNNLLVIL